MKVSPRMETSAKAIYAIGDMAGPPLLAHKAMAEGIVAAEAIAGKNPRPLDYGNVPSCTYCRPQIASIGLTEAKAKENGREVMVGKFPFTASGKAVALGETEGFVKVVADKATGEVLGAHIVGPEATEMIHEFAVGRTLEATLEEIIHTIHAHPTLSEAALEATLGALGQAIHISLGGGLRPLPTVVARLAARSSVPPPRIRLRRPSRRSEWPASVGVQEGNLGQLFGTGKLDLSPGPRWTTS